MNLNCKCSRPFVQKDMAWPEENRAQALPVRRAFSWNCRQHGFSMLETIIAIAILMVLAGVTAPKVLGMIETGRMQSTTRAFASFLQQCRYRSETDGQWYQVLFDTSSPSSTIAYLDINGDSLRQTNEPSVEIPFPITIPDPANAGIPTGFGNQNILGATPLTVDTAPATWNCLHALNCQSPSQVAGLQFNERGLPCQRTSSTAACTNTTQITSTSCAPLTQCTAPVAWITYFAYPTSSGGTIYAAVTVTPAGRIRVWSYQGGTSGGSWQ